MGTGAPNLYYLLPSGLLEALFTVLPELLAEMNTVFMMFFGSGHGTRITQIEGKAKSSEVLGTPTR